MDKKMKNHFLDYYGLTGYSIFYITAIVAALLVVGINALESWRCDNYQEVTGRESRYIDYDSCYVKNDHSKWVRYDSNFND